MCRTITDRDFRVMDFWLRVSLKDRFLKTYRSGEKLQRCDFWTTAGQGVEEAYVKAKEKITDTVTR